jgi:gliding motility-associated-like protein
VTVYPKPVITKSNDASICKNSSVQLFAGGGNLYSWSPSVSLSNSSISNPVASPAANTVYHVTVTDVNSCTNADSIRINIRPDPIFSISDPTNLCENNSMQLNAGGGDLYSWQPSGSLNNSSIPDPTASPQITTNYSVLITDTVCNNTSTLTTTISVVSLPNVKANSSNDLDCNNDHSQLNATGAAQYIWSPVSTLNNSRVANPVANPTTPTVYTVKGTDANGCVNYDSVKVDITDANKSGYFMASAFTPNNDGLNDCYGIKYWGVIQELDFGIYNRWGERIFHTTTPGACWDGTYKGVKQNPDVYVYLVTAKTFCGKVFKKGTFALIR